MFVFAVALLNTIQVWQRETGLIECKIDDCSNNLASSMPRASSMVSQDDVLISFAGNKSHSRSSIMINVRVLWVWRVYFFLRMQLGVGSGILLEIERTRVCLCAIDYPASHY